MISWPVARQAPLSMDILQARILEWVAMPFSRGSSQPRDQTQVSHTAGRFFTSWATRECERRYLQMIALIRSWYLKYTKDSYKSTSKYKHSHYKMGWGPEWKFFQRTHTDGQEINENMFNITNHQGNANQNHNEISLHTYKIAIIKKQQILSTSNNMEIKGTLMHC